MFSRTKNGYSRGNFKHLFMLIPLYAALVLPWVLLFDERIFDESARHNMRLPLLIIYGFILLLISGFFYSAVSSRSDFISDIKRKKFSSKSLDIEFGNMRQTIMLTCMILIPGIVVFYLIFL